MEYSLGIDLSSQYDDATMMSLGVNSNFVVNGPFDSTIFTQILDGRMHLNHESCCDEDNDDSSRGTCCPSRKNRMMIVDVLEDCLGSKMGNGNFEVEINLPCNQNEESDEDCLASSSDCFFENENTNDRKNKKIKHVPQRKTKVDDYVKEALEKKKKIVDYVSSVDLQSEKNEPVTKSEEKHLKITTVVSAKENKLNEKFEKDMDLLSKKITIISQSSQ